jgi:ATP-dependent Lhr-like helicase
MMFCGFQAAAGRLGVEITKGGRSLEEIENALADAASEPAPPVNEMLANVGNLARQKWDGLLSPQLLRISYASLNLDLGEAMEWFSRQFDVRRDRG